MKLSFIKKKECDIRLVASLSGYKLEISNVWSYFHFYSEEWFCIHLGQILIDYSVSKQWRLWSDAAFSGSALLSYVQPSGR